MPSLVVFFSRHRILKRPHEDFLPCFQMLANRNGNVQLELLSLEENVRIYHAIGRSKNKVKIDGRITKEILFRLVECDQNLDRQVRWRRRSVSRLSRTLNIVENVRPQCPKAKEKTKCFQLISFRISTNLFANKHQTVSIEKTKRFQRFVWRLM